MKPLLSLTTVFLLSGMGLAQIPDSTQLRSEPISFSSPVLCLPFVSMERSYDPFSMDKMEFSEPFGLRVKGGRFNSHRFVLNGIPVNNRFYNDIPLTDGSITLDDGMLSGRTPGQSSGIFVITQPLPGKIISSTLELSGGTYFSSDNGLYPQRTKLDNLGNKNLKYSVSGPVPFLENLSFSTGGMFSQDGGYLSGAKLYKTWDINQNASGDSSNVLMNEFNRRRLSFRLLWNTDFFATDFFVLYSRKAASYYSFDWLLTPEGNLRHYQEEIISGSATTFKWSDSFNQTLKLSYQPTQTWGYLTQDYLSSVYVRELAGGGKDSDLFFSNSGGYDNRRYRYQDNLLLFSLENTYKWNEFQESFLNFQSENWWYFEETGVVINKRYSSVPPEMYFARETINRHPDLYSVTGGHHSSFDLSGYPVEFEVGFRAERFQSDGETYRDDSAYSGYDLAHFLTGKKAKPLAEFLPYLSGKIGLTESLLVKVLWNQSADWPSYSLLYGGEYPNSVTDRLFIGNPELEPEKWTTLQLGMDWSPLQSLLITLNGYRRSAQRLNSGERMYKIQGLYTQVSNEKTEVTYEGIHAGINYRSGLLENPVFQKVKISSGISVQSYDYHFTADNSMEPVLYSLNEENYFIPPVNFNFSIQIETTWNMKGEVLYQFRSGNYFFTNYLLYGQEGRPVGFTNIRKQMPSISLVDLNLEQNLPVESLESSVFIKIENLFDKRNLLTVYPQTGKADLKGDEIFYNQLVNGLYNFTYFKTGAENPDFYSPPRKITAGIRIKF